MSRGLAVAKKHLEKILILLWLRALPRCTLPRQATRRRKKIWGRRKRRTVPERRLFRFLSLLLVCLVHCIFSVSQLCLIAFCLARYGAFSRSRTNRRFFFLLSPLLPSCVLLSRRNNNNNNNNNNDNDNNSNDDSSTQ